MRKSFYFLAPVEVVKVTPQNLAEVAEWCGGQVQETESRRRPGTMDSYVWVPTPKGSTISWAFPGMYVTKRLVITVKGELKATWAVFRRDYFEKNYFQTMTEAVDKTWELDPSRKPAEEKPHNVVVNQTFTGSDFQAAVAKVQEDVAKIAEKAGIDLEEVAAEAPKEVPAEVVESARIRKVEDVPLPAEPIEVKPDFTVGENTGPTAMQEAMARANKKAPKIIQG